MPCRMRFWIPAFRDAAWLGLGRALAWVRVLTTLSAFGVLGLTVLTGVGRTPDPWGRPLGTDFTSFWTAAQLAWAGSPAAAWDPVQHAAAQHAAFPSQAGFTPAYYAFFYPPPFLLACFPLALLPYGVALAAWLLLTTLAFLLVVRALLPRDWPRSLAVLAYPAVTLNAEHGQNGALSAALMAAAALQLDRRPHLAGACLGALCFKPQLALMVVPALLAARRWQALFAAAASAATLCLVSWIVLGSGAWLGFFANAPLAKAALQSGLVGFGKMTSSFAAARLLGASLSLAWAVQLAVSAAALAAVVAVTSRRPGARIEVAIVAAASCLATPFLLDYDLTLLAIPLAIGASSAVQSGFLPWERFGLAAAYMLPLAARPLAMAAGLPVAPVVIAGVLAILVQRARASDDALAPNAAGLSA